MNQVATNDYVTISWDSNNRRPVKVIVQFKDYEEWRDITSEVLGPGYYIQQKQRTKVVGRNQRVIIESV